jgi:hypothetical protein
LFYILAEGTIRKEIKIGEVAVTREASGYSLSLDIQNTGNSDVECRVKYRVITNKRAGISRGDFKKVHLFPQEKTRIASVFQREWPKNSRILVLSFDLGKDSDDDKKLKTVIYLKYLIRVLDDGKVFIED